MIGLLLVSAFALLTVGLRAAARPRQPSRHGPVRVRDVVRAVKETEAAASAGLCVWCEELPCDAGPHWRWMAPDDSHPGWGRLLDDIYGGDL